MAVICSLRIVLASKVFKVTGISFGCKDSLVRLVEQISALGDDAHSCSEHGNNAACIRARQKAKKVNVLKKSVQKLCIGGVSRLGECL